MGFWRVLYRCGRTIRQLTVGEFTVTGVPLFLFAFLVNSWEMDGKAECRWLGTSPCDNERIVALRTNALRAYEGKSSELIPPGPQSRVRTLREYWSTVSVIAQNSLITFCWNKVDIQSSVLPWSSGQCCSGLDVLVVACWISCMLQSTSVCVLLITHNAV